MANGMGPQGPRLRKYQDLIDAVELMKIGDPPFRYDAPFGEEHNVFAAAARHCAGTWRHLHNGQLWIIKYDDYKGN